MKDISAGLGGRSNLAQFGGLGDEGRERLGQRCGLEPDAVDVVDDVASALATGQKTVPDVRAFLRGGTAPGRASVALPPRPRPSPAASVDTESEPAAHDESGLDADAIASIDLACSTYGGDRAALRADLVAAHRRAPTRARATASESEPEPSDDALVIPPGGWSMSELIALADAADAKVRR